jgi:hypothetical protein
MAAGERFGRLITVSRSENASSGKPRWLCACDCGNSKVVSASDLRTGNTISCGCALREYVTSDRKHGEGRRSGKSPEYSIYIGMIKRCDDHDDARYGARGIDVCAHWRSSFSNFLADMGRRPSPSHSIDRIDANGNYEPNNCRWATEYDQQNNRTNNRLITHEGKTLTLSQLAQISVVDSSTLGKRLDRGWSVADAISLPASPLSPQRTATRPLVRRISQTQQLETEVE